MLSRPKNNVERRWPILRGASHIHEVEEAEQTIALYASIAQLKLQCRMHDLEFVVELVAELFN